MAAPGLINSTFSRFFSNLTKGCSIQQTRNKQQWSLKFADARMLRDYKKRMIIKEWAPMRVRLIALKRNDILPPELNEYICKDLDALPRRAHLSQVNPRCCVTSRPRGTVRRWRLSRFIFRHLVDYNKMAGVQRALWG